MEANYQGWANFFGSGPKIKKEKFGGPKINFSKILKNIYKYYNLNMSMR